MTRPKEPAIPIDLLDQLLAGGAASAAFEQRGLCWIRSRRRLTERALNAEIDHHLASGEDAGNKRYGHGRKTVTTEPGKLETDVPRDRQSSFDPQLCQVRGRGSFGVSHAPEPSARAAATARQEDHGSRDTQGRPLNGGGLKNMLRSLSWPMDCSDEGDVRDAGLSHTNARSRGAHRPPEPDDDWCRDREHHQVAADLWLSPRPCGATSASTAS